MTIDINNVNVQKLKLADLIADATARGDNEALEWLREQAMKKVERKDKQVYQSVNMFRMEYLERFCGYQKKKTEKLTAEQKRERRLNAMFDKAKASIEA